MKRKSGVLAQLERVQTSSTFLWKPSIIGAIVGFLGGLAAFLVSLAQLTSDLQALYRVSWAGYIIMALSILALVFGNNPLSELIRKLSLVALALISGLYFFWIGTQVTPENTRPRVIDSMDAGSMWRFYPDGKGSTMSKALVAGRNGQALQGQFVVIENGYAGLARDINPEMLAGTDAIGITYKSAGDPNTLEIKLIYLPDETNKEAVFSMVWNCATEARGWTTLKAAYKLFTCWQGTRCAAGEPLDITKVGRLEIAVSNKPGDLPGGGTIWIDEIIAYPDPLLLGSGCSGE